MQSHNANLQDAMRCTPSMQHGHSSLSVGKRSPRTRTSLRSHWLGLSKSKSLTQQLHNRTARSFLPANRPVPYLRLPFQCSNCQVGQGSTHRQPPHPGGKRLRRSAAGCTTWLTLWLPRAKNSIYFSCFTLLQPTGSVSIPRCGARKPLAAASKDLGAAEDASRSRLVFTGR